MPEVGVEPTRPGGHGILSPARLPVPPLRPIRIVARSLGGPEKSPARCVSPCSPEAGTSPDSTRALKLPVTRERRRPRGRRDPGGWARPARMRSRRSGERGRERPAPRSRACARSIAPEARCSTRPGPTRRTCGPRPAGVPRRHDQGRRPLRLHRPRAAGDRATRDRRAGRDRRRRHAVVRASPPRRRRAGDRNPQDDGQRRPRDRLLHRLDGGDSGVQFIHNLRTSAGSHERIAKSSSCSADTAARRRSSPPTWPESTARSSPRFLSTSTIWPSSCSTTAQNPSRYAMRADGVGGRDGDERGARVLGGSDAYGHRTGGSASPR